VEVKMEVNDRAAGAWVEDIARQLQYAWSETNAIMRNIMNMAPPKPIMDQVNTYFNDTSYQFQDVMESLAALHRYHEGEGEYVPPASRAVAESP